MDMTHQIKPYLTPLRGIVSNIAWDACYFEFHTVALGYDFLEVGSQLFISKNPIVIATK